ncbi:MAG: hypothetical protein R3Y56_08280, partial [Akkermansia sp.]
MKSRTLTLIITAVVVALGVLAIWIFFLKDYYASSLAPQVPAKPALEQTAAAEPEPSTTGEATEPTTTSTEPAATETT